MDSNRSDDFDRSPLWDKHRVGNRHIYRGGRVVWRPALGSAETLKLAFFDIGLNRREVTGALLVAFGVMLLSLEIFNTTARWLPLASAWIAASYLTPFSALMLQPAAVIVPFPPDLPFKPATLVFAGFLFRLAFGRRVDFSGTIWLLALVPFIAWLTILFGLRVLDPMGGLLTAVYFVFAVIVLMNDLGKRYAKALLAVALGSLTVTLSYWGNTVGLPIELSGWGGAREGFSRLGGARLDSVMVWPLALTGLVVPPVLAAVATAGVRKGQLGMLRFCLGLVPVFLALPVLVATMTHGGAFSLVTATLLAVIWGILLPRSRSREMQLTLFSVLAVGAILVAVNAFDMGDRLRSLAVFYDKQTDELGWAASRTHDWELALDLIQRYPFTGAPAEELPDQAAHNAFLTFWSRAGLPAFVFFSLAFFGPAFTLFRRFGLALSGPFLLGFAVWIMFLLGLSFVYFKPVWIFWAVLARASLYRPRKIAGRHLRTTKPVI